jgi:alcohol dehydrogenase class IV
MAMASLCGGIGLANAGLGAVHGFAGPIGGMFAAPHGAVCAALLPIVMSVNLRALRRQTTQSAALRRYDEIGALLTGNGNALAEDGVLWVTELVQELSIPKLGSYGIRQEHIPELVKKAANASSMKANPVLLREEELVEIVERAL